MSRLHHLPLFHPRLVRDRIRTLDKGLFALHQPTISTWLAHLRSGDLDDTSEVKLHGGFLERIFGDVLGYHTMATAQKGRWEIEAERRVRGGGSADGAIGLFEGRNAQVLAPIELKGAAQFLEHAKGRSLTPIQQGWDYANKTPESRWIIVSNYRETRLYAKSRGPGAYELFLLQDLASEEGFLRFVALLGRDALLSGPKFGESPLYEMLLASERTEREITERLYAKYRGIRAQLFDELRRKQVRIRCLAGLGQGKRALELLDEVEAELVTPADKRESLELRAVACESAGLMPEAARAWLACAQLVEGAAKQRALTESARLALASGDELGALFVTKAARAAGFELPTLEHTARVGLQLDDANVGRDSAPDRLARAEALVASGMNKEAIIALRSLQQKPTGLDDAARGRLALALGRALYAEYGIDLALSHFRNELEVLTDAEQRRAVYVLAGELLEDAGRIDEAIEAYRGRI